MLETICLKLYMLEEINTKVTIVNCGFALQVETNIT